ncbi:hypothetical protein SAMD00019534_032460 [Acytostelium subglobosum LB1]|uniref:hypothetical protein n=1 Tax=Acytostelium subglobosum LB1 TaxID=1410327 RepID=UPI0006451865|nr:hypothetical protein SAMD00019534_032460 [Acytostelium subglobosum LB1]GAM20071.1 hypothetical protein SAMD00019534_032460 [Acytostelium subglobosum LB1]|eukprot:XP_012756833.1 hypothetical protein SAMD00019534_032460 [Acytostelium subglobosum LB1]
MAVYNKYQRYFTDKSALKLAVKAANLAAVKVLLHQTDPVVCDRGDGLLVDAIISGSYPVLKYLLDSGMFKGIERLCNLKSAESPRTYYTIPRFIRAMMDDMESVPQVLVDHVKSLAIVYPDKILATGDQQLINEFLYKDGIKLFCGGISSYMMIPDKPTTCIEQLEHMERLLGISDAATHYPRVQEQLKVSKESAQSILSVHSSRVPDKDIAASQDLDDHRRLLIAKLLSLPIEWRLDQIKTLYHEYVITGDCLLIPLLIDHYSFDACQGMINQIVQHGTFTQAIVTIEYKPDMFLYKQFNGLFHSFFKADDMKCSFEIIKYLDSKKVTITPSYWNLGFRAFSGTAEMLEFMLAKDTKNIFSKHIRERSEPLGLLDVEHVKLVLPSLTRVHFATLLRDATYQARIDTIKLLLDHKPILQNEETYFKPHEYAFHKVRDGQHREVIKLLVEKGELKPLNPSRMFEIIGELGDIDLLDYGFTHFLDESATDDDEFEKLLNVSIKAAIERHNVDFVIHVYAHHRDKMSKKKSKYKIYHIQAVTCANVEMLECLLRVDPLETFDQADMLYSTAISHVHIEVLDWLLKHLDEEHSARFMRRSVSIKPLIESNLTSMLQHLLDIGQYKSTLPASSSSKTKQPNLKRDSIDDTMSSSSLPNKRNRK